MSGANSWKLALAVAVLGALPARGAQLPIRRYTTAEGLVNNDVHHIVSDPRGFLWFATGEGLSRFDGYGFSNLTTSDGLPHRVVEQLLIDRRGNYWLATPAGLVRFRPDQPGAGRLLVIRTNGASWSNHINALLEDRAGRIWCGTHEGIFTIDPAAANPEPSPVDIGMRPNLAKWGGSLVESLAKDPEGAIWIGTADGTLYRLLPNGHVEHYALPPFEITELFTDRQGRLWIGTERGLYKAAHTKTGTTVFEPQFGKNGVPQRRVFSLLESRDGGVWAGMYQALVQFPADGQPPRVWAGNSGLDNKSVTALAQDRDGNLWLGTNDLGAWKLAAEGFLTYSPEDGLGNEEVISVGETLDGELFATSRNDTKLFVNVGEGEHFYAIRPLVPKSITYYGWRPGQLVLQDRTGEWWLGTNSGLCRYPRVENPILLARTAPLRVYTTRDGLPSDSVARIYEDRRGNIWVGSDQPGWFGYWSRTEERFVRINVNATGRATAYCEDRPGHVWIGDEEGRLWRVEGGRGLPVGGYASGRGWINGFLSDRAGRLWVATSSGGLLRFDQPSARDPQFRSYGLAEGLSSVNGRCLVEDGNGLIYIGTGGGVDRLDPDSGYVRHYTTSDGLASGQFFAAHRDRDGNLWFGAMHGLSRMIPASNRPKTAPSIWITGLSIAGRPAPVSSSGERSLGGVEVRPGQEQIQFDFVGLSYAPGEVLGYQHHMGDADWSAPTQARSVNYGALPPGLYHFAVRAINSDGVPSPEPAVVEFRVIAPLWRRAWFQAIFIAALMACAVAVHRARVRRLIEIERVRMRIATDLHDDLGSSLSQIAILSDVARGRARGEYSEPIERIGSLSRDLLESMSDIVWAIQPMRDRLSDLKHRMRRFAADVLTARNIEMQWSVDESERDIELDAEIRRQVYLVFKESINNLARHSGATEARIGFRMAGRQLTLEVSDNGRGFERWDGPDGNGLKSMKLRASSLGGTLEVRSTWGCGTTVLLCAPLPLQVVRRRLFRS